MKPATDAPILAAALIVSLVWLSPSRALADELPKDTNQIERLTPEQAKKLAAEFPGVTVAERVESMTSCTPGCLPLNGLKSLDAATARELVKFKGQNLYLNGLTTLDADTAKALAVRTVASLYLNGLTTLDVATAQALAGFKGGGLYLNGLTTLDVATAQALAGFEGGGLYLNGLTRLDVATANALAEFKGRKLELNRPTTLDAATAKALTEFKGVWLSLNGLTRLDADIAKTLAEFKGSWLSLNGLTTLDAATAKTLAALDKWDGDLSSIVAIESPDSVEIAAALAKRKGPLRLPNLKKISPKTLTALIEKEDVKIPLIETLELIQEPDGSPTEDFVIPKGFETRQKARQQGR